MMKIFGRLAGLSVLTALLVAGAQAKEGHEGHHGHEAPCPMSIEGADVKVTNTADGVSISITARDPSAVKKIQEAAAARMSHKAGCPCCSGKAGKPGKGKAAPAVYTCSMAGCYEGPNTKDGRCPRCGMNLKKK